MITFGYQITKKIMKKNLVYIVLSILYFSFSFAQSSFWNKIDERRIEGLPKMERSTFPNEYELYSLDLAALKNSLIAAPIDLESTHSPVYIAFPNPTGELVTYQIFESPMMETGLAQRYTDIKTYVGKGISDPTASIRFSITLFGLHSMGSNEENGTFFIDTYTKNLNNYIVYKKSSVLPSRTFACHVIQNEGKTLDATTDVTESILRASDGNYRVFRLAMACTIEYAAFHVNAAGLGAGTLAQKKAAVLAAMVVTMNRVNFIYERDMSLRMQLIANNDAIIYITSDNFTNDDAYALIDESQNVIDTVIGNANYDIGHTVSTGGGGLAGPSPCVNGFKASGITGSPAPVGDPYDIDYVAHEMGHQFGANHTFNSAVSSCGGGNRNASTAVEPGSGSTIMAYAGICPPQDVQPNSDALFHAVSIAEMVSLINNQATCAVTTANNNAAPVAQAGIDYTIPKGTAFVLRGAATDSNNDALTYCWEQTNPGANSTLAVATTTASVPNYRSRLPVTSPNRYMPALSSVVAGNLTPSYEITPSVARTFNFALTVRDNRTPLGGQTGRDNMVVTVNGTAGPFTVTSQNTTGITWQGNSSQTITWNVAGTTANNVNCSDVKISLSTDNGLTFSTVLVASTPNDGTETITVPNSINSTNCRLMIEGVNNIFYAVNTQKFTITPNLNADDFGFADFVLYPNPNKGEFLISFNSNSTNAIQIEVHDVRGRSIYADRFSNSGLFSQEIKLNRLQAGLYFVTVQDGGKKVVKQIIIE